MYSVTPAAHDAFRSAVLGELGPAVFRGFISSYYRTFAVPTVASELLHYGASVDAPAKRATDTAIVIYEIVADPDGPRAEAMADLLRHAHRNVSGETADFQYVLYSLLITPARFLERYGPRPFTSEEIAGGVEFFASIGARMGITNIHRTYDEWCEFSVAYEGANVQRTKASDTLIRSSLPVLAAKLPTGLKWASRRVLSALVMDELFRGALTLPSPGIGHAIVRHTLKQDMRRAAQPFFTPGQGGGSTYPNGYTLNQVGPGVAT